MGKESLPSILLLRFSISVFKFSYFWNFIKKKILTCKLIKN